MKKIDTVIIGTFDSSMVWDHPEDAEVLLFSERTGEVRMIVAVDSKGAGLLQVADAHGVFGQPENVLV
jgi:hypothetical protein